VGVVGADSGRLAHRSGVPGDADVRHARLEGALVQYLMWPDAHVGALPAPVTWLLAAAANLAIFPYAASAEGLGYLPGHTFAVSLTLTFFARDVLIAAGTVAWLRATLKAKEPVTERAGEVLTA